MSFISNLKPRAYFAMLQSICYYWSLETFAHSFTARGGHPLGQHHCRLKKKSYLGDINATYNTTRVGKVPNCLPDIDIFSFPYRVESESTYPWLSRYHAPDPSPSLGLVVHNLSHHGTNPPLLQYGTSCRSAFFQSRIGLWLPHHRPP